MGNTIKAFLYGMSSIADVSGSMGKRNIKKIINKNINNGYKADKKSISEDFYNAINKIK